MANYPTINVADIFQSDDAKSINRRMKIPQGKIMSYEELNAWYKARIRNHKAIRFFLHLLAVLLTGPLFHFIWLIFVRPIGKFKHRDWVMEIRSYTKAHILLAAIQEKLKKAEEQYNESLLYVVEETPEGYSEEESTPTQSDKSEDDAPVVLPQDARLTIGMIDINQPETVQVAILHGDTAKIFISMLDDQTLIRSFIRPELTQRLRRLALHELFSRSSETAVKYLINYLSFYISRDSLHQQPLSSTNFARFSEIHSDNSDLFALTQTARVKFGDEKAEHLLYLLNHGLHVSKKIAFFCQASLNANGVDIPFLNSQGYTYQIDKHAATVLYALGGDLSKIAPCYHKTIIQSATGESTLSQLALDQWDKKDQRLLTDKILEICGSLDVVGYYKSFLRGLNVDQLDTKVLQDFIRRLLFFISLRNPQYYLRCIHALCQVLNNTQNESINQWIAKNLMDLLHSFRKIKNHEQEHWKLPLIQALCCVKFNLLTEDFKEEFIEFLHDAYKDTPSRTLALYILTQFKIEDITEDEENTLVLKCIQQKSLRETLALLESNNFYGLSPNSHKQIFRNIVNNMLGRKKIPKISQVKQNILVTSITLELERDFAENSPIELLYAFYVLFNFDLHLIDATLRLKFIDIFKRSLVNPDNYTMHLLIINLFFLAPLIELTEEEQTKFLDYLYALSIEPTYTNKIINGLCLIDLSRLDDEQLSIFCTRLTKLAESIINAHKLSHPIFPLIRKLFSSLGTTQKTLFFELFREFSDKFFVHNPLKTFQFLASLPFSGTSLEDYLISKISEIITKPNLHTPNLFAKNIVQVCAKLQPLVQSSLKKMLFEKLEKDQAPQPQAEEDSEFDSSYSAEDTSNYTFLYNILALMRTHSLLSSAESEKLNMLFFSVKEKSLIPLKLLPLFWNNKVTAQQKSAFCTITSPITPLAQLIINDETEASSASFPRVK